MGATSDNGRREKTAVYVQALRLIQDGQAPQARARADQAVPARPSEAPATSAEASERFAAALVRVITDLPAYAEREPSTVSRAISAAHAAGRPAWAAAVRAAHACGLIAIRAPDQAIEEIVVAEAELATELALPGTLDPFGSPSGPAAAANNLGAAYELVGLHGLAEPHFVTALDISARTYGPEIESQVSIDLYNLATLQLVWALELATVGDTAAAAARAHSAADYAHRLRVRAAEDDQWPALELAARSLELGAASVAEPTAITDAQADTAAEFAVASQAIGAEITALTNLVSARTSRLRGRAGQSAAAADAIAALHDARYEAVLLLARYEAMAAAGTRGGAADACLALALADRLRLRDLLQSGITRRSQRPPG